MVDETIAPEPGPRPRKSPIRTPMDPVPSAPAGEEAKPQGQRNPEWPAQYGTDGWDEVPAQMRP